MDEFKRIMKNYLLCLVYVLICSGFSSGALWNNEVASGEHLDDLIGSSDRKRIVAHNTMLILHKTECPPELIYADLPLSAYLYVVRFDVEKFPEDIWYKVRPTDDLGKRYGGVGSQCMDAVFLEKGKSLDQTNPPRWSKTTDITLEEWAWQNLEVTLDFENNYGETLIISQTGLSGAPVPRGGLIYEGEELTIKSYPGFKLFVKKADRTTVIYNTLIGLKDEKFNLESYLQSPDLNDLIEKESEQIRYSDYLLTMHYFRIVQMLKQPVFCHNYTETGYKKIKMPDGLYKYIKDFFYSNYDSKRVEGYGHSELLVINKGEVSTAVVDLTPEANEVVISYLQPILEEWCKCELEFKVAFGIREYYTGNVLHNHVDNVYTHVISALINVDQEVEEGQDWLLEVVSYDGIRREIKMDLGDMVLYESAKLIHGRPKQFTGKRYANCFYHFAPTEGWNYEVKNSILSTTENEWKESLDDLKFHKNKKLYTKIEL